MELEDKVDMRCRGPEQEVGASSKRQEEERRKSEYWRHGRILGGELRMWRGDFVN